MLLGNGCGGEGCCNCDNSDCCRIAILKCILGGGDGNPSGGGGVLVSWW